MRIDQLNAASQAWNVVSGKGPAAATGEGPDFSQMLSQSIDKVNADQVQMDESITNFMSGKGAGLHETMLAMEKADVSLRLLVQVRNKAVEAYREIMRMQI